MATSKEYMDYIAEQLHGENVTIKKMFGEYALYCNEKIYSVVCDERFLVKITPSAEKLLPNAPKESPYAGAKPMLLVEDTDNAPLMRELARNIAAELPEPKPKKPKAPKTVKTAKGAKNQSELL